MGDFINRVNTLYPEEIDNEELNSLLTTIKNQGEEIEIKEKEILRLQTKIEKIEAASDKLKAKLDEDADKENGKLSGKEATSIAANDKDLQA